MKADQELSVSEITDEMQKASTDAFAKYKRYDDMLGKEEVAELLRELDLLKYMTSMRRPTRRLRRRSHDS